MISLICSTSTTFCLSLLSPDDAKNSSVHETNDWFSEHACHILLKHLTQAGRTFFNIERPSEIGDRITRGGVTVVLSLNERLTVHGEMNGPRSLQEAVKLAVLLSTGCFLVLEKDKKRECVSSDQQIRAIKSHWNYHKRRSLGAS